jgi:hypothetical protein
MPRLRRAVVGVASAVVLFVAFGGFLHTKWGRPLMMRLFGASCPMFSATAESVDRARHMGVAFDRGAADAPARPALGFTLDSSTRADVASWASAHDVDCKEEHDWLTRCVNVAPIAFSGLEAGLPIDEVTFGFRPDGKLSNVSTFRRKLRPDAADKAVQEQGQRLYRSLGMIAGSRVGSGQVSSQLASSTRVELRYRDYSVDLNAVELPSGVAVREQYLSARD